jgi:hypothetical protein
MDAQGHHAGQQIERRFDVMHPLLHGPGAKAIDVQSFDDTDRAVLVPGEGPVRRGGFVEQDGADRLAIRTKGDRRDRSDHTVGREERP